MHARTTSDAESSRGEPSEARKRVLRATWQKLHGFQALLTINTGRYRPRSCTAAISRSSHSSGR
jgi:hypothetical protein